MIVDGEGAFRASYISERSDELAGLTPGALTCMLLIYGLSKPKSGALDFITILITRVAVRFRAKKPSPQTTQKFTLVCLRCGRTVRRSVGLRSRDCQIFSDG